MPPKKRPKPTPATPTPAPATEAVATGEITGSLEDVEFNAWLRTAGFTGEWFRGLTKPAQDYIRGQLFERFKTAPAGARGQMEQLSEADTQADEFRAWLGEGGKQASWYRGLTGTQQDLLVMWWRNGTEPVNLEAMAHSFSAGVAAELGVKLPKERPEPFDEQLGKTFDAAMKAIAEAEGRGEAPVAGVPGAPAPTTKSRQQRASEIARQAEALAETIDLWEFVAPPLLPWTDDVAVAFIQDQAAGIIGRQLGGKDLQRALDRFRDLERRRHLKGNVALERAAAAQQILASTKVQEEVARVMAELGVQELGTADSGILAEEIAKVRDENPDLAPEEIQSLAMTRAQQTAAAAAPRNQEDLRRRAEAIVMSSPEYREVERAATRSFTPFTQEDVALQVQSLIGDQSPVEEAGVDMRAAFEGLMAAINGQATQARFVPGG